MRSSIGRFIQSAARLKVAAINGGKAFPAETDASFALVADLVRLVFAVGTEMRENRTIGANGKISTVHRTGYP